MSTRKVYADFQDGNGYIDISDYVRDTLTISIHGFNDSYKYAQNECSFDVVYSSTIYPLFRNASKDILIRVADAESDSLLLTESQEVILTESHIEIAVSTGTIIPVFTGHIPLTHARTYNGLLNNTTLSFTAEDNLSYFDVDVGDVVFTNCKVYDAADTDNSIVHKLAAIAGWDVTKSTQEYKINTVLTKFASDSETDSVLDVIDTLLHEYGYAFNLDAANNIAPVLWNVSSDVVSDYVFDEDNIIKEVSVTDSVKQYDGATITYYELGTADKVRLYKDGNCTYNDDGSFAGYDLIAGYTYPPETNTIDPTTGTYQVAYQEYTDDAITYKTNYAVVKDLGYDYSAFSSDFSSIVATANHFVDRSFDTGMTIEKEEFGNKKCRLIYKNPTSAAIKLYYNEVYGSVWYKSSERELKVNLVDSPSKRFTYTMKYVFDKVIAESYVKARISQDQEGATTYEFTAEIKREIGTVCTITMNDGTNQLTIIRDRSWDEATGQYTYECRACSVNHSSLTAQGVSSGASISTAVFSSSVSTSQLSIPLLGGTSDYSSAWVYMYVYKDGVDVSSDWTFAADATSGITGSFVGNKYVITDMTVASGTVTLSASRTNWTTQYASIAVSKAIDSASVNILVATVSSIYLGIGILAGSTTANYTSATVTSAGVITVGSIVTPTTNSWMINYSSTNVAIGMYIWSGSSWQSTTSVDYISSGSDDLCGLTVAGISIPGYTVYMAALIKSLFTKYITLLSPGYIQSDGFVTGSTGFKIEYAGNAEFNNLTARGTIYGTSGRFSAGLGIDTVMTAYSSSVYYYAPSSSKFMIICGYVPLGNPSAPIYEGVAVCISSSMGGGTVTCTMLTLSGFMSVLSIGSVQRPAYTPSTTIHNAVICNILYL